MRCDRALAAVHVDDRDLAVARRATTRRPRWSMIVGRSRNSTVPSAIASRFDCLVELRRAADVEGPHRQLGARLADRLRRDDADRFADVDRRTAGEIAPVALAADADLGSRRPAASGSSAAGCRSPRSA